MNLKKLMASLWRRWYLVLGGLLVTVGLCAGAFVTTSPVYERNASELLVPGSVSIPVGGNPYLYLGGLGQASDVLVRALNAEDVVGPIVKENPGTTISIARDTSTSGPMITITVSGNTDAKVATAFTAILSEVPSTLDRLQNAASVASDARITTLPLTVDATSTLIQKGRIETVGFVGIAGLALTVLLVGLIDGLVLSRASRKKAKQKKPQKTDDLSLARVTNLPNLEPDDAAEPAERRDG